MLEINQTYLGDCLEIMKEIDDKSIDMILCDLPYGNKVECDWDKSIIPLNLLWEQYNRIIKDNCAIVLTGMQPFTTDLINSQRKLFKYCLYWNKMGSSGFQNAKNKPLFKIEDIIVFSKAPMGHLSLLGDKRMKYNPIGIISIGKKIQKEKSEAMGKRPNQTGKEYEAFTNFPNNLLEYKKPNTGLHPTQKPVELFEYLIKLYSNENELILDNCAGSGTTAIAAINTNRNFILIEKEEKYFNLMNERISKHLTHKNV